MLDGLREQTAHKRKKYLIVGGDDRFIELVRIYQAKGYDISTFGMDKAVLYGVHNFETLAEAVNSTDIVIGPVPFAKDGNKVNAKYAKEDILIQDLFKVIDKEKIFLLGAANKATKELASEYGIRYTDYYGDESYQILNTIPTVEGTIAIIINEIRKTIFGSRILILGYGRIGKMLSEYLNMMGAEVYVEARKEADLTWILSKRLKALRLDALSDYVGNMDIIVNTVPALILNRDLLDRISSNTLLLDLASAPGGIDFQYAAEKGIKAIHALGIPGKMAYRSAAEYIFQTIEKMMESFSI